MNHPHQHSLEARSRYSAMESMALLSAAVLSIVAVVANVLFPSSLWFLGASALGGALLFLNWHSAAHRPKASQALLPVVAVLVTVLGLLTEIERSLPINFACGLSVVGAVMFGLIEVARRIGRNSFPHAKP
ncbi:MAG: hypothetical protein AB7I35_19605 [Ramlibacter sp.]